MRKLILIALLICGAQMQAQKTFKLFNLTGNTVIIDDLVTNTGTANAFPQFHSKPNGPVSIPPFGTYTLTTTNATRFPFFSPTSTPTINSWERATSATSSSVISSTVAFPLGTAQVFYWIQVRIGATTKQVGFSGSGYPTTLTSSGWTASYTQTGTGAAPIYNVTIQ
ncbi:hypothetical protein [Flavobacterium sp.]|uniref:hypothetical protein n=1 Tax=Flavobacterium sp. TaxID=239 RepID=UPI00262AD1B4|nr:hypothetical protein [Flavobacterium sp.]